MGQYNSFLLIKVPLNIAFSHPFPLFAVRCWQRMGRGAQDVWGQGAPYPAIGTAQGASAEQGVMAARWPSVLISRGCCSPKLKDTVCFVWQGNPLSFH